LRAEVRAASNVAVHISPRVGRAIPRLLWGLLPLATIDVVLFVIPMVFMALFSFRFSEELLGLVGRWTVAHYVKVFTSEGIYLRILVKTIVIAVVATAACLLVGYPFAYFIANASRRWQSVLLTLVIMPFWTSYLLRVYAWTAILGDRGLINEALRFFGVTDQPLSFLLFNVFSEIVVFVYLYIPYTVLAIYASLEKMDRSLVLAAMDLGATPVQTFLRIVLPQTLPGVYASIVFVFIPILGEYVTPTLVGGMSGVLITNLLVNQIHALEFGFGAAIAFVMATFVLMLLLGLRRSVDLERLYVA